MVTQTRSTVNALPATGTIVEAALTSYAVVMSPHQRPDVTLRLHGYDRACIVHLPADLATLRMHLDLTPTGKPCKAQGLIVTVRDDGQRLHFVGLRLAFDAPTQPALTAPTAIKEARITRYFYEIAVNKQKLTLYIGLEWVTVTNHVTIAKIIAAGFKLKAGWRNLHPDIEPWTVLYELHGKKLVFSDVRPGLPTPKPDIAPRTVRLIDYVSWQGRAMLKIEDAEVGTIFLDRNELITAAGLEPVPTITKLDGWLVSFQRKGGEVKLISVQQTAPVAAPAPAAPTLLLPARTLTVPKFERLAIRALLWSKLPSGAPIPLPAPLPEPRTAKDRRYTRRLPSKALPGETLYRYHSECWLDLPRGLRHETMRALDPLVEAAIRYAKGEIKLLTFAASRDEFQRKLITVRSLAMREETVATPAQRREDEYATLFVQQQRERAARLKQLVHDLLDVDIDPDSGEFVTAFRADGTRFTYQLSKLGDGDELKVMLWSPALGMSQVSELIAVRQQVPAALESLRRRHNALADRLMKRASTQPVYAQLSQ